jgi:site-specific DNA-methyltransferase (adenine-specific)
MQINKIYHSNFLDNTLPDKCAKLIVADPPYYKTKGDFDFIWKTFEDYLSDVEIWAKECKRLLADNGTLFWYGSSKRIAYAQIIFDKHFNLINNLVWNKGSFMGLEESEELRSFAPCTERILMYGLQQEDLSGKHFEKVKFYFWEEYEKSGLTLKKANELMGLATTGSNLAGELFGKNRDRFCFPTLEKYNLLQKSGFFKKEYDELKKEYDELRRPFKNDFKLQEVLNFSNEASKTGIKYDHDTVKPDTLTRALILTCSRPNDLVLVPFSGSGTECAMAAKENRNFIGFDIEKKYVEMGNKRCVEHLRTQSLFS